MNEQAVTYDYNLIFKKNGFTAHYTISMKNNKRMSELIIISSLKTEKYRKPLK